MDKTQRENVIKLAKNELLPEKDKEDTRQVTYICSVSTMLTHTVCNCTH